MNESYSDPQLRSFRLPVTTRLRQRIDELRDIISEQKKTLVAQRRDIVQLEKDLRKANRDNVALHRHLVQTRRALEIAQTGRGSDDGEQVGGSDGETL